MLSFFIIDITVAMHYYFFYFPVFTTVIITALAAILMADILARFLFTVIKQYRALFIFIDIIFILLLSLYGARSSLVPEDTEFLIHAFSASPVYVILIIFLTVLAAGIKAHYFLKIACGDFIDEKYSVNSLLILVITGLLGGIVLWLVSDIYSVHPLIPAFLPLILVPTTIIINFPYNPVSQYAKEYEGETQKEDIPHAEQIDNPVFYYINIPVGVILFYCFYVEIMSFYEMLISSRILFFAVTLVSVAIGLLAGSLFKPRKWHIYLQMLYPPLFLTPVLLLYHIGSPGLSYYGIALFSPFIILFSMSLHHGIRYIFSHYRHQSRFNLLDFSFFIIPISLLVTLHFIPFTYFWFFSLAYITVLITLLLPGLYLVNRPVPLIKKGLYLLYVLLFIPSVLLINMLFPIQLNNDLFIKNIAHYDTLKNINYNASYIKSSTGVTYKGSPIFTAADSTIRNLKRSLAPVSLYYSHDHRDQVLFIDGNQRFFRNPGIGFFKRSICLDPLSDRAVDYNTLPISGRQSYIPDNDEILFYLRKNNNVYSIIVDFPNLFDQSYNAFRFSKEYYTIIKKHLNKEGIFAQVYNIPGCSEELLLKAVESLNKSFDAHCVYLFSNILVILSSDTIDAFTINKINYYNLGTFIQDQKKRQTLFFDEQHALSHLFSTDISELKSYIQNNGSRLFHHLKLKKSVFSPPHGLIDMYLNRDDLFLDLVDTMKNDRTFINTVFSRFRYNKKILELLKATELYESQNNFEKETGLLFELKKLMTYRIALQEYLVDVLAYKEKSYFNAAVKQEEEKKWETAAMLYKSILGINRDNFDANYRMGLLSITLQDIENASYYLHNAMRLKRNDPKVFFQMGVLEFTEGNVMEAIDYFNRALAQKEISSSIYLYLGLSYEELDKPKEAEYYYSKALMEDPNDINIQSRIENIKQKREEERKKWQSDTRKNQNEEELDVDIPIPINKSAYEIRLDDEKEEE